MSRAPGTGDRHTLNIALEVLLTFSMRVKFKKLLSHLASRTRRGLLRCRRVSSNDRLLTFEIKHSQC